MATDTAAATVTHPAPPRRLWQVPTFLVGAAAFAAAYLGFIPIGPPDLSKAFKDDLAALTAAAERHNPDVKELELALDRVAKAAQHYPEFGTPAHVTLAGGYSRLAELTADGGAARGYWVLARQHFLAADETKVPAAEKPKFVFRRAKALAADLPATATAADIELIRTVLSRPPIGEDPGDAPRLVAELSIRLSPPDRPNQVELRRAKDAFTSYLTNTGLGAPPGPLARAKLRLSEVHLALGDPDGAKKWLTAIGTDAPPDVLPYAKAQLARVRMAEHDWAGAAREWEAARTAPDLPPAVRTVSAYFLADCKLRLKADDTDAAKLLEEASKSTGPEGSAAAVRLAGLSLKSADPAGRKLAVGYLTTAVRGVKGPADLAKGILAPVEYQAAFEQAVQVLTADGSYPEAVAAATAYASLATGGKDREKKAEALTAWGDALEKAGSDGKSRYAAAAGEFDALADARPDDADKAEQLRRAAGLYRKAGDAAAGLAALEKAVAIANLPDEVSGPVWADYADGLLAAKRPDDALKAIRRAISTDGPAATAARHKLARNLIDSRDPRKIPLGVELLTQIASKERVSPAEQEYHEKALVELGDTAVRGGDFQGAEARLRTQLRLYPSGPEGGQGRVLLATALLARIDPKAKTPAADAEKAGEEALGLCKQVLADVEARKVANRPLPGDPWLHKQANLRVMRAYVLIRKPYDALHTGDRLRREYAGQVEELIVMSFMYHAYQWLERENERLAIVAQMRDLYNQLKDTSGAFPSRTGEYSREFWERWLNLAAAR